jgi:hypothetical protein
VLNEQRHQAARVSGVVDIGDAHQFDNGVIEVATASLWFVAMKYSLPWKLK